MRIASCLVIALALAGCDNAGQDLGLPPLPQGAIGVGFYFDRDGSGTQTSGDTVFAGARVSLLAAAGTDTIRTAVSGSNGVAVFDSLPVGTYRVVVDRSALGDSIGVVVGDTGTIQVIAAPGGNAGARVIRLGYREVTIAEARQLAAGMRVYVRGIVQAPLQAYRDSSTFLASGGATIRLPGSRHRPGRTGNNPGDSVLVLGTTAQRDGQPVIASGLIGTLGVSAAPVPIVVTIPEARTARNGTLDAALVSVLGAVIVDTMASGPDLLVRIGLAADTTVTTDVIIDAIQNAPRSIFRPGLPITVRGVLVPRGDGTWVLKPRGGADVTIG
ncbi:MAG: hypothetical protein H0W15_04665 [Gemmatimonadales bacterium]|nr:hypothetical protein [Gemmatimonadales bacterium]